MKSCVELLFVSLLTLCEAQGTIVTPVFVLKGRDLLLKLHADPPEGVLLVNWKINKTVTLVRFDPSGKPTVIHNVTGGFEFPENKFSVILKNVQEVDSGVYSAEADTLKGDKLLTEYKVTVQGPVSPVELIVDRVDNSSESCDLHVTCRTHNCHISSTFRCVDRVCIQGGRERPEVTTSGASLQVYLLHNVIICNHSNQVHWTHDFDITEHLCPSNPAEHLCSDHAGSVFLVKMVVFSVGLIIMVSAVITVHLVDFKKHQQRNGCQTRHAAREESSHLKVTF
uniref:Immunoglobulin subtype domain-containing protein n=1 Tax=Gasterosteus aculeatus aculeatus TaxID=481459 RepID=A0AAQ4RR93_GASAC